MKLPQVKPKKLARFFRKQGFIAARQAGSHQRLVHPDGRKITIAIHNRPISLGTLSSILRQAEISRSNFLRLYKKKSK
jgi:predicted RNA binding protein YcfA (HicA-like mRNA interferase family)